MIVKLSPRQSQIANLLLRGVRSGKDMSAEIGIEVQSIDNVKRVLFKKCAVHSTEEFVLKVSGGAIKLEKNEVQQSE